MLVAAAIGTWLLVHRTTRGRVYFAVGNNEQAARFAGIDVSRHVAELYILSGLAAGLAAIIYVAHLGQAKADAGTGYELTAVTAVVLGGTAINGGSGSVAGDAARAGGDGGPPERAAARRVARRARGHPDGRRSWSARLACPPCRRLLQIGPRGPAAHEDEMRNSQLAVLCGVILAGALIVAGSNWWLVHSLRRDLARPQSPAGRSRRLDGATSGARPSSSA